MLAEQLPDGALPYILAARLDLEDFQEGSGPAALGRNEYALAESSGLLRETVTQLHPAALRCAGPGWPGQALSAGLGDRSDDVTIARPLR